MDVFEREPVRRFLEAIEAGFNRSTTELVVFLVLILGFLAVILVGYAVQVRRERRRRRSRSQWLFTQTVRDAGLTPEEYELIERMLEELPRKEARHRLVTERAVFDQAVRSLGERGEARDEEAVASLRLKLGFGRRGDRGPLRSTTELEPGQPVRVELDTAEMCRGRISLVTPRALVVELDRSCTSPPQAGSDVMATVLRSGGRSSFAARIKSRNGRRLELAHAEEIANSQEREFYRRAVDTPVVVTVPGTDRTTFRTRLTDLGGGGASLALQPDAPPIRVGEHIMLTFDLPEDGRINVSAQVVRLSRPRKAVHVRFDPMEDRLRDRIVRHVLA
jgi:c-di-GMP-binding flagellar brake protein YcgR